MTGAITIEESGITFGPFKSETCYRIEKSKLFAKLNHRAQAGQGLSTVEFIVVHQTNSVATSVLYCVEAKSSVPRETSEKEFALFVNEIKEKFLCSIHLCMAQIMGRHPDEFIAELPLAFHSLPPTTPAKFILVIPKCPDAHLNPLKDALLKVMRAPLKLWGLPDSSVAVWNTQFAQDMQFAMRPSAFAVKFAGPPRKV